MTSERSSAEPKLPDIVRFVDGSADVTVVGLEYREREGEWIALTEQVVRKAEARGRTGIDVKESVYRGMWASREGVSTAWALLDPDTGERTGEYMRNMGLAKALRETVRAHEIDRGGGRPRGVVLI